MNAVLLPQITAPTADSSPHTESVQHQDDSSDTSSDTSSDSDSDELQTLTDESDNETISNIQRINLLFQGLEDPDYDYTCATPEENLLDH
jgi:hypothetical protein